MSTANNAGEELMTWIFRNVTDITDEEQDEVHELLEVYVQFRIAEALEEHIRNG